MSRKKSTRHQRDRFNKFTVTTPCVDCPFRKDATPGWLGETRATQITDGIQAGYQFSCHKTTKGSTGDELQDHFKFCAGALHLIKKTGMSNLVADLGVLGGQYHPDNLRQGEQVVDTVDEFINLHSNKKRA